MIPLLPKWHLHGNRPTFYDGDAVTMLELASTLHASMNNIIDDYNKLEEAVNKTVTEFITGEIQNREVFETAIRQEFQDFIDIVNLKVESMSTEIEQINATAEKTAKDTVNEAIESGRLQTIDKWDPAEMTVLTIGDSFGDTVLYNQGGFGSWVLEMEKIVPFKEVHNYCKNSSGYFTTQERPYMTLANEFATAHDPKTVDLVIIQGGLNDVASNRTDGISGSENIDYTFDYIKATFTNAQVLVVPMTWSATFNGREPYRVGFSLWCQRIIESAVRHGFRVADRPYLWNIGHPEYVGSDNFHPNVDGAKNIAGHIIANIFGNDSWNFAHFEGNIPAKQYITWRADGGTFHMSGVYENIPVSESKQVIQPIPESLVPPKNDGLSQMFTAYMADSTGNMQLINAGYQLGVREDGRGQLIFYGGKLNEMNPGDIVSIYFWDNFTV